MKKTIPIAVASFALLLAGGSLATTAAQASSINTAESQYGQFTSDDVTPNGYVHVTYKNLVASNIDIITTKEISQTYNENGKVAMFLYPAGTTFKANMYVDDKGGTEYFVDMPDYPEDVWLTPSQAQPVAE